jgi:hypothetical protein
MGNEMNVYTYCTIMMIAGFAAVFAIHFYEARREEKLLGEARKGSGSGIDWNARKSKSGAITKRII